jgi:hypothetical protein
MNWRQQIGVALCGTVLLAVMAAVATKTMIPAVARGELKIESADTQASQSTFANRLNSTSRAKTQPIKRRLFSQPSPFEIISPSDVGSVWDDGPAYDLSQ